MRFTVLTLLLTILIPTISATETTNNLVSTDFTSGWTNTGNTYHGSNIIAGVHGGTVESDSVSLNAEGINKESLNEGFSITGSANVWFWNNETQSVTQTIKTVDDNGQTITQNRTLSGSCATWNGCSYGSMTDTLIIGSNSQQDYDVNLKYTFSVPNQTSGHYGADLKNPSLSVTYTYVPPLDSATQTALLDLNNDIKDDLKDVDTFKFEEDDFKFEETFTEMPEFETYEMTEEIKEEDKQEVLDTNSFTDSEVPSDEKTDAPLSSAEDSQDPQEPQTSEEEPSSLQAEQSSDEESDKESQTSTEEKQTEQAENDSSDKQTDDEKKTVSLADNIKAIDVKVKDPGKNMELKNLVKLDAMVDNTMLLTYGNVPFYKDKKIYTDQINIFDNRILYDTVTLVSYQQKDPVFQQQKALFEIRQEKQKLIREIQVLKNAG
jgi:hypothetical protein